MKKNLWISEITAACRGIGTYRPQFDPIIDTLATILEERDAVHEQYVAEGSQPTVIHTNKAKEANVVKNPQLVLEMDLNSQALAFWRDLGLTPAGLRKLNAQVVEQEKAGGLERLLAGLTDGS